MKTSFPNLFWRVTGQQANQGRHVADCRQIPIIFAPVRQQSVAYFFCASDSNRSMISSACSFVSFSNESTPRLASMPAYLS